VVEGQEVLAQLLVLAGISMLMTIGVYGLVACIVKIDDLGLMLNQKPGEGALDRLLRGLGGGLLRFAPWLMKALGVVGTVAMFLVGGGILLHASHALTVAVENFGAQFHYLAGLLPMLIGGVLGLLAGVLLVKVFELVARFRGTSH
jgi:predicted DNA repair protein MutK